jgi:hypothetical protein
MESILKILIQFELLVSLKIKKFGTKQVSYFVYYTCKMAGCPKHFFSPHSIRTGVVCDMLMKAVMSDTHPVASVFEQAKILGNWVTRSTAFSRYIKKSMLGTLIASGFVNPDQPAIFQNYYNKCIQDCGKILSLVVLLIIVVLVCFKLLSMINYKKFLVKFVKFIIRYSIQLGKVKLMNLEKEIRLFIKNLKIF